MARPLRIEFPGAFYHVTSRGNERKEIFRDNTDRDTFLRLLGQVVEDFHLRLHAYVMMDNHYHLLVETPRGNLSKAVGFLNGVYTQAFNRCHRRVGHLFQGRYKAILVEKDSYLLELSRYIHLNPWRVKNSKDPFSHRWSSLRAYAGLSAVSDWLTVGEVLAHFGLGGKRAYRHFVKQGMEGGVSTPWQEVKGQVLLGSQRFRDAIVSRYIEDVEGRKTEASRVKELRVSVEPQKVLAEVGRHFGIKEMDLKRRSHIFTEPRYLASYLLRKHCSSGLKEIGKQVGLHYSAVGNAIKRVGESPTRSMVRSLKELETKIKHQEA